jgi:hypothetical protein
VLLAGWEVIAAAPFSFAVGVGVGLLLASRYRIVRLPNGQVVRRDDK